MQRSWRLAVCAVTTGLLTAGGIAVGVGVAYANFSQICHGNAGDSYACPLTGTIPAGPAAISVQLTVTSSEAVSINKWTITCTDSNGTATTTGGVTAAVTAGTPDTEALAPLPATSDGQCTVNAPVSLPSSDPAPLSNFTAVLDYTPASSASPSPSASSTSSSPGLIDKGYASKCLDDAGNSSADRAKIQIWTCNPSDKAQLWTYGRGELVHNGKCLNDQHSGGNGSKVILYTCNRALNELWTHLANGEYVLNARGYRLCLDDPAYSTKNGTQLIVYTCRNTANQHWQQP